jgi:DNA-binding NtrC family response regulator
MTPDEIRARPNGTHRMTAPPSDSGRAHDVVGANLVGASPSFLQSLKLIERIAACDATVLIEGETGTGKELAARAIHYRGGRRRAPFVPVNCGAIPEHLIESELFGHVRGAFTDAREARDGVIAQAEGGTLFLDEIEAMSPRAQVAFLRFLQDREYRPVGGTVRSANVRLIGASNAALASLAAAGAFRSDLLFRLSVLPLVLPPLRDRDDDVVLLAETFLVRFSRQYDRPSKTISSEGRQRLRAYAWPGNVRELENLIHREVLLDDSDTLRLDSLPSVPERVAVRSTPGQAFREAKASVIATFERNYVRDLLSRADGNITRAAQLCGKDRSRFGKLVKKYGVDRGAGPFGPMRGV